MKLSELLTQSTYINKKAKLLTDISLDNGEVRKKGDIISILLQTYDGKYHAEDNDFASRLDSNDFQYIN